MKTDHYKISPTAVMCARARADYTHMPYAKEIYNQLSRELKESGRNMLPQWLVSLCLHIPSVKVKASILEGRYYSTDKAIQKLGQDCAVLELASGLSSRGLEMSGSIPYFIETDLEDVIENKKEITNKIKKNQGKTLSKNHHFLAINPIYESDLEKAAQIIKPYSSEIPLAVVHEGLFGYLNDEEQVAVRDNIGNFLEKYNPQGAWITPDFSYRSEDSGRIIKFIRKRIARKTERPSNGFASEDEVRDFLEKGGLNLEFVPNEDIARNLSCIDILNLDSEKVVEHARNYRATFITLK